MGDNSSAHARDGGTNPADLPVEQPTQIELRALVICTTLKPSGVFSTRPSVMGPLMSSLQLAGAEIDIVPAQASARWLHRQHRPLANACSQRRELSPPVRRSQRFRAGVAARRYSKVDSRAKDSACEGPKGIDRLAERKPR